MDKEKLNNAYRLMSNTDLLDVLEGNFETEAPTRVKVFVIMHQINDNPEHVKIEGIFLDEERARTLAQTYDFAWVDDHTLTI